ncbi:DUF4304 domain-containing protein [Hymenobacter sediminicola]|uniref:DUF4304 domain-containing protein n=1 Tax=Hymenobacter sediminicola TaxID=2761579 RepID=A0A7G7W448_9BACT|nr:DUF4304 domain-containing protein [Hymenobacter sediminicola]QNH61141.1 DUF4304 domain-containing protein [Hymenobacter sediminicola]
MIDEFDVQAQFTRLLSGKLWPEFKKRGYKRYRGNFRYYDAAGWGKIVNVQKSAFSTKDNISFTINMGLYLREAERYLMGRASEDKFLEPDCLVRKRIDSLAGNDLDLWYNLDGQTVWSDVDAVVTQDVYRVVLPYLDGIRSVEDILHQLVQERGPDVFAGIRALFIYGRKAEARQWLADERNSTVYTYRKKQLQELSRELNAME